VLVWTAASLLLLLTLCPAKCAHFAPDCCASCLSSAAIEHLDNTVTGSCVFNPRAVPDKALCTACELQQLLCPAMMDSLICHITIVICSECGSCSGWLVANSCAASLPCMSAYSH
jgi:hypothetical protein